MRIIINADDFGFSLENNKSIMEAFKRKLISSSTVLTNMDGFSDAVNLINTYNLHGQIGIHLNLSVGKPLTDKIKRIKTFTDNNGNFSFKRNTRIFLSKEEKRAVFDEFEEQLMTLIRCKIHPTHIDSHHHVHTEWDIGKIVILLAKKYNIPSIRLTRNTWSKMSLIKKTYKVLYNYRLSRNNLKLVDYFGDSDDLLQGDYKGDLELMVHPLFRDGALVDLNGSSLDTSVKKVLEKYRKHKITRY
jgi:chitin disaccharide deacetylase